MKFPPFLGGGVGGSGSAGRVAIWSSSGVLTSAPGLRFDSSTGELFVGQDGVQDGLIRVKSDFSGRGGALYAEPTDGILELAANSGYDVRVASYGARVVLKTNNSERWAVQNAGSLTPCVNETVGIGSEDYRLTKVHTRAIGVNMNVAGDDIPIQVKNFADAAAQIRLIHTTGSIYCDMVLDNSGYLSIKPTGHLSSFVNGTSAQEVRVYGTTTGPKYLSLNHNGTDGIVNVANSSGKLILGGNASQINLGAGEDIQWGKALVTLGGGATATLGTIGGSGPATAGQNSWVRMLDSTGAACWVPAWK